MKCPHCNREHEEGMKYCPYTGEEIIPLLLSCPNPDCENYGKHILPSDFLYCPRCRTSLLTAPPPPPKHWSSLEDFERGDIIVDGIVLGKTTLSELEARSYDIHYRTDYDDEYRGDLIQCDIAINDHISVEILHQKSSASAALREEYIQEFRELFIYPDIANPEFALNRKQTVNIIHLDSYEDLPCFAEMGLTEEIFYTDESQGYRNEIFTSAMRKHGWYPIDNFLDRRQCLFTSYPSEPQAIFKCNKRNSDENTIYMLMFDHGLTLNLCEIAFAVNLTK